MTSQQRAIPSAPKTAPALQDPDAHTLEYDIEVITPILGGGARAKEIDPVSVIRPSSVRGHLRFWWRATVLNEAGQCPDTKWLLETERKIFGSTKNKSALHISIQITSEGQDLRAGDWNPSDKFILDPKLPKYFSFPLRQTKDDRNTGAPIATLKENVRFNLKISLNSDIDNTHYRAMIETATKCWINFGGIGARTRRGFGALFSEKYAFLSADEIKGFLLKLNKIASTQKDILYPRLVRNIHLSNKQPQSQAFKVWKNQSIHLENFRQKAHGRNHGDAEKPGRSFWPEAESVRFFIEQHVEDKYFNRHEEIFVYTQEMVDKSGMNYLFPRAEFGMPLKLHLRNEKANGNEIEIDLLPEGSDRLSSPLITRLIKLADGSICAAYIYLFTDFPERTKIDAQKNRITSTESLTHKNIFNEILLDFIEYPNSPFKDKQHIKAPGVALTNIPRAISAFLGYVKSQEKK